MALDSPVGAAHILGSHRSRDPSQHNRKGQASGPRPFPRSPIECAAGPTSLSSVEVALVPNKEDFITVRICCRLCLPVCCLSVCDYRLSVCSPPSVCYLSDFAPLSACLSACLLLSQLLALLQLHCSSSHCTPQSPARGVPQVREVLQERHSQLGHISRAHKASAHHKQANTHTEHASESPPPAHTHPNLRRHPNLQCTATLPSCADTPKLLRQHPQLDAPPLQLAPRASLTHSWQTPCRPCVPFSPLYHSTPRASGHTARHATHTCTCTCA